MKLPSASIVSDRRAFLTYFSSVGLGGTLLPDVLWARLQEQAEIDLETIRCAEELAGLSFTPEQREQMLGDLTAQASSYRSIRDADLLNSVPPALVFDPFLGAPSLPGVATGTPRSAARSGGPVTLPATTDEVAYLSVTELAELIRTRQIGSEELTRLYLSRIDRLDATLHAVVTVTAERGLAQARVADREIANGGYRGLLHGIPWGAKDLLAVRGYPTTWGTPPFRSQRLEVDAAVVQRLDAAGAVLIAKLSLGELAWGDVWFGGQTRNPWNLEQGSSGSSAGPGAATAAGMVGFSIGSETLGSISSPSSRTGVTGLRPTFGRVPRTGAMALSWSMDKLGPMCRSVEDCGLVLEAIAGADGEDPAAYRDGFRWEVTEPLERLRVGFVRRAFERSVVESPTTAFDVEALGRLTALGVELVPIELPDYPYDELTIILNAEAAAAFDQLTRSGRDAEMVRQERNAWPNVFRAARTIPAVEYINANRIRTLAIESWRRLFESVDVIVSPTNAPDQLTATNLTGHPAVILPNGFQSDGTPVSLTFIGRLLGESALLSLAAAYQEATGFHLRHPTVTPVDRG
jgi:Asp-tRNA(Asn)/Glu-tRNA(Gln) amidotransferase A subunit family amidase